MSSAPRFQPRAWRALVRALFLMALRNQSFARATGAGEQEVASPVFWVVGQYLVLSGGVSALLFMRVDVFFFAFSGLALSMFLTATSLVVSFQEVILNPDDRLAIGHRPVTPLTWAAARMTHLVSYLLLLTVALNLFPALLGAGLRDSSWLFVPAYALASLVANVVTGALVVLLSSAFVRVSAEVRDMLAWTQIVLLMVAFYGGQATLREASNSIAWLAYRPPSWLSWLPPAWLASPVQGFVYAPSWETLGPLVLAAATGLALLALACVFMAASCGLQQAEGAVSSRHPGRNLRRLAGGLSRDRARAAGLWLTCAMLGRDSDLVGRNLPYLGMAAGAVVVSWTTGQLQDPFVHPGPGSVMSLISAYLLVLAIPAAVHGLAFSRDFQAAWMLRTAPCAPSAFVQGALRALLLVVMLPCFLALFVATAVAWGSVPHAALHVLLAWMVAEATGQASSRYFLRGMPYSRPPAEGEGMGEVVLFQGGLMGVLAVLGLLGSWASAASWSLVLYAIGLCSCTWLLRPRTRPPTSAQAGEAP